MGKLQDAESNRATHETQPQPTTCCKCGWDFIEDNERRFECDNGRTRRQPRTAIRHGLRLICDECHDKVLMQQGRHSTIGTGADKLHRDALWPTRAPREAKAKREPTKAELDAFAARFGKDD